MTNASKIGHYISGEMVSGMSGRFWEIYNPSIGEVQAIAELASSAEVKAAIDSCENAFPSWSELRPQHRVAVLIRFVQLVEKNKAKIAEMISLEHGKTIPDAIGEIQRGIEAVEFTYGMSHYLKGDYSDNVGKGIDTFAFRQPLGVVAGITPFNFPIMIPMWMLGNALATGNTMVLKPSEKNPSVPLYLAQLLSEAGAPPGILNVINGDKEAVDTLLTDKRIQAISFVGSSAIAEYIYATGAANGKRIQAMGGAKNHMIILPDADMEQVVNALIGAAYGSAGERCMAISIVVPVGNNTAEKLLKVIVPKIKDLNVGPSLHPESEFGPLVTREHLNRVCKYIQGGIEQGAKLLADGRSIKIPGYENGFFLGGCLFDQVTPEMDIYKEEIFGPVLSVARTNDFEEALSLATNHQYGNGVALFTRNGNAAREFTRRVNTGMVGINVPIPVPLAFYSFGGWKRSAYGGFHQHGPEGVRFFTKLKNVVTRWPDDIPIDVEFDMPTLK